jgi:hypothetical protein
MATHHFMDTAAFFPGSIHFPKAKILRPGMHTIEIYFPQFYFTQVDMEDTTGHDELRMIGTLWWTSVDTLVFCHVRKIAEIYGCLST